MAVPVSLVPKSENFAYNFLSSNYHHETKYWDDLDYSLLNPLVVHEVDMCSKEACELVDDVICQSSKRGLFDVVQIDRIQNPYLMTAYLLNKEKLMDSYGHKVRSRTLLHGTLSDNIASIIENNFDFNFIQRSRYGRGIYFTTDLVYASKFSDPSCLKRVIVANVLQTASCTGYEDMDFPDAGCDTSENLTPHCQNVIVKYDEDTFCPSYVLTIKLNTHSKHRYSN